MNKHPNTSGLRPFKPGKDHPRHRSKANLVVDGMTLAEIFRSYTTTAANYLGEVLQDPSKDDDLRLKAASVILARGWGDVPKQLQERAIGDNARAIELTEADLLRIASSVETGIRQAQVIDVDPSQPVDSKQD